LLISNQILLIILIEIVIIRVDQGHQAALIAADGKNP